tara:strand:+ start:125 stop:277 length:153 start_codon:yes stop_codon:yes gene_type:complete
MSITTIISTIMITNINMANLTTTQNMNIPGMIKVNTITVDTIMVPRDSCR